MTELFVASLSTVTANADRRTLDGREYLVVPAVAIVEGVLNGHLVQANEIGDFAEAWNGRPFVLRHPQAAGQYISANSPTVLEQSGLGHLFNARMDGDRLKCELWLDIAKATALGGDAVTVLQRFEAGQPVELSTGYFCDIEDVTGTWNGKRYSGIQRNLRPDHIAALPGEVGACSWKDGCGAPRVNRSLMMDFREMAQRVVDALNLNRPAGEPAFSIATVGESPTVEPVTNGDGCTCAASKEKEPVMAVQEEVKTDKATKEQPAATPEKVVEAPATNAKQEPVAQPAAIELPAEVVELATLVRELGGVNGVKTALQTIQVNANRMRSDLVARIQANRNNAFTAEMLQAMPVEQLEALERSLRPADYSGRSGVVGNVFTGDADWEEYQTPTIEEKK